MSVPAVTTRMIARETQRLGAHARPGLGRSLGLLGDGDAVAGLDQPGEITSAAWTGTPHIGIGDAVMLAARSERDVEHGRGDLRILEEHLEEIAHAVEEQAVFGIGLQREILRHHAESGRGRGRGIVGWVAGFFGVVMGPVTGPWAILQ